MAQIINYYFSTDVHWKQFPFRGPLLLFLKRSFQFKIINVKDYDYHSDDPIIGYYSTVWCIEYPLIKEHNVNVYSLEHFIDQHHKLLAFS